MCSTGKFPGKMWNFEKVVLFSDLFLVEMHVPFTSFHKLFAAISVPPS